MPQRTDGPVRLIQGYEHCYVVWGERQIAFDMSSGAAVGGYIPDIGIVKRTGTLTSDQARAYDHYWRGFPASVRARASDRPPEFFDSLMYQLG